MDFAKELALVHVLFGLPPEDRTASVFLHLHSCLFTMATC